MFEKILKTAHDSGGEVLVQIKNHGCEQFKGRVQELNSDCFTLFHSGPEGGVLWAFKREDIAFCGLIVELPQQLGGMSINDRPSSELYPQFNEGENKHYF